MVWAALDPGGERRAFGRTVDVDRLDHRREPDIRRIIVQKAFQVVNGLLGALMRAGRCVKATIIEHQPSHWDFIYNM